MAKMKIHELAKELDVQSKDIVTLLQDKGIDVKSHMNTIEDDAVGMVKAKYKKEIKTETEKLSDTTDQEAPKKKKSIIFVSNPQNSKMPGSNIPKQMPKPAPKKTQPTKPVMDNKPAATETITKDEGKETSKMVAPKVESQKNTDGKTEEPKKEITKIETAKTETASATNVDVKSVTNTQNNAVARPVQTGRTENNASQQTSNQNRPQGTRTQEQGYQQRSYQNGQRSDNRPYNNNRPNTGREDGGQRPYNNNGGQRPYNNNGGQRPYNNNGGQRPYNNNGGQRPYNNNGGQRPYNNGPRPYNNGGQQGSQEGRPSYSNNGGQRPYNNNGGQRPYNNNGAPRPYNNNGAPRPYNNNGAPRPYNNNGAPRPYNNQNGRPDYRSGNGTGDNRPYNRNGQGQGGFRGRDDSKFYGNKDSDLKGNDRQGGNRYGTKPQSRTGGMGDGIIQPEKHRDEAQRRINQEKDKKNRKDYIYEEEKDIVNKNKAGRFIKPEKKEEIVEEIKVITLPETLTIKELADKMKILPSAIVKKLFLQGQIVTVNQEITYEQAENIAIDYEIMCEQEVKIDVIEELLKEEDEDQDKLVQRPPVICVMGHVDHGKTSLLDAIRKTNVTDREAGGITQHIGAYTVNVNGHTITFLDTPGHEAFTAMRMRGANATDIAILVVAADDGVMPQTIEAINHAKAAGIEIIVAVNKIDKPNANIERVKQELTEYELISEDWGGSTVFAPVSAKTGKGIPELLEMILLTADILELKANPERSARGLVIEAELDKGRGPVATVLVQKGTLHVGDFISAGASHGKVRAMLDDKGRRMKEAAPSTPVEILGLDDVPNAGEIFLAHDNDKEAKMYADTFISQNKQKLLDDTKAKMSLDDLFTQIQAGNLKELNIIVKADVQGSVEAVKTSLLELTNEEVVVKVIHSGVGAINESDVILASASNAIIIGFNVRPDAQAKGTSEREGVDMRLYKVIYQAIEDVQAAMKGMLDPVYEEKIIGHAEVRQIFKASSVGNIAGSYVLDGEFQRNCKVRITREGTQIYEGKLESLKRFKDDVKEVKTGFECGLVFEEFDQMQELDIVEAYIMVEVPR